MAGVTGIIKSCAAKPAGEQPADDAAVDHANCIAPTRHNVPQRTRRPVGGLTAALAAGAAQAAYKDGTYTGEGKGRESMIQVQVDVKDGKIADVKVVKHGETEMIIAAPIETMLPEIVKKNGVEGVDSVGGATLSSDGIKAAVKDALSKAQ